MVWTEGFYLACYTGISVTHVFVRQALRGRSVNRRVGLFNTVWRPSLLVDFDAVCGLFWGME